jgi:hypothetical protein
LSINGKDRQSGSHYLLLAGAAVVTNTTNRYTVYPGGTASANVWAVDVVPEPWQLVDANPVTYSVGAVMVVSIAATRRWVRREPFTRGSDVCR